MKNVKKAIMNIQETGWEKYLDKCLDNFEDLEYIWLDVYIDNKSDVDKSFQEELAKYVRKNSGLKKFKASYYIFNGDFGINLPLFLKDMPNLLSLHLN